MGNRWDPTVLECLEDDRVFDAGPHRVPGEALGVGHHHLRGAWTEGAAETLDLRSSRPALRRRVGLVAHEHRILCKRLSAHARQIDRFCDQRVHLSSNVVGCESSTVEGRVRQTRGKQAT